MSSRTFNLHPLRLFVLGGGGGGGPIYFFFPLQKKNPTACIFKKGKGLCIIILPMKMTGRQCWGLSVP